MPPLKDNMVPTGRALPAKTVMVGQSAPMRHLARQIEAVGRRNCTVLVQGETGTGKELAARQVHAHSPRADQPFIPVDCATFSPSLFESQLFGHVKGAFTGAERATLGFFRAADAGTLFLDEVGELPLASQAKLLRCIQDRAVVPLGAVEPVPVNVRIVAATHRDLAAMVRDGQFREDLYFRLNVVSLHVPPLRKRRDDILPLAEQFLKDLAETYEEPICTLSAEAAAVLRSFDWPGNVRQLQNALEHACVFCSEGVIRVSDLPDSVRPGKRARQSGGDPDIVPLSETERLAIARALRAAGGNQSHAARMLGIERHQLRRKILRHHLQSFTKRRPR